LDEGTKGSFRLGIDFLPIEKIVFLYLIPNSISAAENQGSSPWFTFFGFQ
jgi:hypothetical protein